MLPPATPLTARPTVLRAVAGPTGDTELMTSINFEFLRPNWPELAGLGGFAECYARPDPESAVVKLRTFGEQLTEYVYQKLRIPRPYRASFNELLGNDAFEAVTPRVVLAKLHALRKEGNRAAHGEGADVRTALWLLKEAFDLGCWLHLTHAGGSAGDYPTFCLPAEIAGAPDAATFQREKKAVLERLAAREARMQELLAELDATRTQAQAAEADAAELRAAQAAGSRAADSLHFDEEATRHQLVDVMLSEAGWKVGEKGATTDEVGQEIEVLGQPTPSGKGRADYVLYDADGTALGVVETKKTATDAEAGRTQAKCYADGLAAGQNGVRPFIFYSNGYDLWLWNDADGEPPRRLCGFPTRETLQYRRFQRAQRRPRSEVHPAGGIIDRLYQYEAVKRVVEAFAAKRRKALIVMATGTGKTRVAVALCDALIRAKWARRILFLCDRRELRKQANNAFKEHLPGEPRAFITAGTAHDRDKRIYLATYPAMMKCYQSFDVGFFDLIIADESHRSIYNRYRDLFAYFDASQVGLTATPVKFVSRHTYELFGCEEDDPTFNYSYQEAIANTPPWLATFEVETATTPFLREGISYSRMSRDQRDQLDAEEPEPSLIEYDRDAVDRRVFNKDTNKFILRNLMERGIRDATGSRVGKSIIFARDHNHAVLLQTLFDEMYPQYGGKFCRVIDNYDPRAEELIDDFKGEGTNPDLTIAISVDMLDTGIDVPQVVNLVFAKPIYSYVKFWQMIGRGTRLCPNLFGAGKNKDHFLIFDHWGNFAWFDEKYKQAEPAEAKSLMQLVFESRVKLAEAALAAQDRPAFDLAVSLIGADIAALPEKSIAVREKWREVKQAGRAEVLGRFEAATRAVLAQDIAPLMQWRNIAGHEDAYRFDRLVCQLQIERLKGSGSFDDLKAELLGQVAQLPINLSQVAAKATVLDRVKSAGFWGAATVQQLEEVRGELRGVMRYRTRPSLPTMPPKVLNIKEDPDGIERKRHVVKLDGLELVAYRNRVLKVLTGLFDTNATLQRIKAGQPVSETDLQDLVSLVLTQEPGLDLNDLVEYYPETAGQLDQAIRGIIGLDPHAVQARFADFVRRHPELNSHQTKFLELLQNHVSRYGGVEVSRLYEPPFTTLHNDGLDGLFDEPLAEELLAVIGSLTPQQARQEGDNP
jgi:type I restriction enzyme R subunit